MQIYLDYRIQVMVDVDATNSENARDKCIDEGLANVNWKLPQSIINDFPNAEIVTSYLFKEDWEYNTKNPKIKEAIKEGIQNRKVYSEKVEKAKQHLLKDDNIYKVITKAVSENRKSAELKDFLCEDRRYFLEAVDLIPGLRVINEPFHKYSRHYDPFIEFTWE
jgi:hypothetical protein